MSTRRPLVNVNNRRVALASGDALPGDVTINAQTGTSYTLVLADASALVGCANAGAITLTVPPNSSVAFPIGAIVHVSQDGAGAVTVSPGSGVTINRAAATAKTRAQWSMLTLIKRGTDTWQLTGDAAAS